MKYRDALRIARAWHKHIGPYCKRFAFAGGLRRRTSDVTDIDLVIDPITLVRNKPLPLFPDHETQGEEADLVFEQLEVLKSKGLFQPGKGYADGFKNCKLILPEGIKLDISAVRYPAQWGVILALRSGPAEFSHWLVTNEDRGGPLPDDLIVQEGAVGHWILDFNADGQTKRVRSSLIETPEERDFFDLLQLPFIEPQLRKPNWKRRVEL